MKMTLPTGRNPVRSNERPGGRAFTLIELIVVMTMLAVVISVTAPVLSRFFHGRVLDSEARRLLALTRHGQSRAVSEGIPMVLWVDTDQHAYGLQEEPGYEDTDPKAVGFALNPELQLDVIQADGSSGLAAGMQGVIRFQPDGSISEGSAEGLRVSEQDGAEIWLIRSLNRLNYEIATNAIESVRR